MKVKHHSAEAVKFTLTLVLPVLLFLIFLLFPFYWMFITSVKPDAEIYASPLLYWPQHWTWMTYEKLFGYFNFIKYMKNSLTVAVATMVVSLVFSTLAAYAFSRFEFKGRKFLMGLFLSNNMFPTVLLMIPLYSIMRSMNLLYTPTGLVLAYTTFTIPFSVWLIQGFIRDVPFSLEEAALIDGCNRTGAFVRIFLPILTPCLLAAGVYIFMQGWNEYTLSSMFTNPATRTIPVALNSLIGQLGVEWDMLCAGGTITVLPVCIMFFFAQKKLVSGLTAGAVKG
ncbi:carbohydrate ABC transporter permease [Faecalispora jeddahensis]|uniref:carbohydrate ABC transporter permease n=1 Tax=Faecalispora jeddahensis TaxID=1414721 RepID=UPI0004BBE5A3|nr:carbohydrate ABC transporter permease [Faecalispora jeddahensis]